MEEMAGITFETILPLIGAAFVAIFGVFVWLKNPRARINLLFLAFCAAIGIFWLFGTFEMYLHQASSEAAVFWDRYVYIGVVFVPSLMHHFSLVITGNAGQRKLLAFSYAYSFVFLVISQTSFFVDGLIRFPRVVHSKAMLGHHLFLSLFFVIASIMFVNLYRFYRRTKDRHERFMAVLTAAAFLNILLIGGTAYLPAYGVDIGYPFSYFSGVFFVILLSFAVAKFQFLSARVLAAEMFTLLSGLIFLASVLLSRSAGEAVLRVIMLAVFVWFGIDMVRSTRREIERREEIQRLAEKLKESNLQLKHLDELKSTMVSIASHQIRGPLGGMRGYLAMFLDGDLGPLTPQQRDIMALNQNVLSRLINSVETFLDITKLESGKILLRPEVTDLVEVASGVCAEFDIPMKNKGLTYACRMPKEALRVNIDPDKMKHVVFNLVENAMKYTEKGGIDVVLAAENGRAILRVTDTGMGIPKEDLKRLFGKFERGELAVDRGGSGLGLYVVKMLTEMQGGTVEADSPGPGRGTIFTVSLPLVPG